MQQAACRLSQQAILRPSRQEGTPPACADPQAGAAMLLHVLRAVEREWKAIPGTDHRGRVSGRQRGWARGGGRAPGVLGDEVGEGGVSDGGGALGHPGVGAGLGLQVPPSDGHLRRRRSRLHKCGREQLMTDESPVTTLGGFWSHSSHLSALSSQLPKDVGNYLNICVSFQPHGGARMGQSTAPNLTRIRDWISGC